MSIHSNPIKPTAPFINHQYSGTIPLSASQSPRTHPTQMNIDRPQYHRHSAPRILQVKSFLIHQSTIHQIVF